MDENASDPAELREALMSIERSALSQKQLIEDLLDTARIGSGKLRINPGETDARAVVQAAIEAIRPAADAKGIELTVLIQPDVGVVWADADRIQQIVWNLVANAVKFTPAGGRVDVSLRRQHEELQFRIKDTGKGIAAEFLPRLFKMFSQAENPRTRISGGLGLGLSICKQLVDLHGGHITAESDGIGKGAVFIVTLPLPRIRNATSLARGASQAFTTDALQGVKLLLVEDQPETRRALSPLLSASGAEVQVADSGSAAMEEFKCLRPDIIVSDIGLPEMDGYILMRRIREIEAAANSGNVPAIALTAFARDEDRRAASESGFQKHVAKPVDLNELLNAILTLLDRGA